MTLLIKICGLSTPETLDAALDAGADMVGFVFFPPSPRNILFEVARALGGRVKGRARKVALAVDADDALMEQIVAAARSVFVSTAIAFITGMPKRCFNAATRAGGSLP